MRIEKKTQRVDGLDSDLYSMYAPLMTNAALAAGAPTPPVPPAVLWNKHQTAMHAVSCSRVLGSLGGMRAARAWCDAQGFGAKHSDTVVKLASQILVRGNSETLDEARARLVEMLEGELEGAAECVVAYTRNGEPIVGKDRGAIVQYTKLLLTLKGLDVRTHVHVDAKDRPLRELTTEQLLAEAAKLDDEMAGRALPADVVGAGDTRTPEDGSRDVGVPGERASTTNAIDQPNTLAPGDTPGDTPTPAQEKTSTGVPANPLVPTNEKSSPSHGIDFQSIIDTASASGKAFRARATLYGPPSHD